MCTREQEQRKKPGSGEFTYKKKTIIEIDGVFQTMSESKPGTWVSPERLPSRSFGAVEKQRDVGDGEEEGCKHVTWGGDS